MIRTLRTLFLVTLLLEALAATALARIAVGVTPALLPGTSQAVLAAELSARLGEPVQVRSFDSEAAQLDWLIRFRELDAAIFTRSLVQSLPAGTLVQLADLPIGIAATHSGLPPEKLSALRQALRAIAEGERAILGRPTAAAPAKAVKPAAPGLPQPAATAVPTVKPAAPAPASTPAKASVAPAVVAAKPAPAPATPSRPLPPALSATPTVVKTAPPAAAPAGPAPALPPHLSAPSAPAQAKSPATPPSAAPPAALKPAPKAPTTVPAPAPQAARPTPPPVPTTETGVSQRTGLLLVAALVLLIGIAVKLTLLIRHWQRQQQGVPAPPQPPAAETFSFTGGNAQPAAPADVPLREVISPDVVIPAPAGAATAAAAQGVSTEARADNQPVALGMSAGERDKLNFNFRTPAMEVSAPASVASAEPAATLKPAHAPRRRLATAGPQEDGLPAGGGGNVIASGKLGKTKAPALLKRCAEMPGPVVLHVRTPYNEISIHFAYGQICHASSGPPSAAGVVHQSSKLGYLMVREELISDAQRDRVVELMERQPGLRFAAALKQIGILDLEALRQALARQAITTVYFLTLFPEGDYRIETDGGEVPAEERIALQVEPLIREAAQHQAEWTAIRKMLPRLDTILGFTAAGHEKLNQVRLSVHQHLILSQVDGQTPLGRLCGSSTMLDYEACRFLYLMVKAGVLEIVVPA